MKFRLLMATAIAAVAFSSFANAKTSSEYGSYYGKVNVGYGMTKYGDDNASVKGKGYIGSVALGYQFANNFRSELELYMDNGLPHKKDGEKFEVKTYAALVNFAYDFKNSSKFTPFFLAGVGYGKDKAKGVDAEGNTASGSKNHVKYQVGAGIAFEVEKNMNLEVAYKALHKGHKNIKLLHAGTVGVRVNF